MPRLEHRDGSEMFDGGEPSKIMELFNRRHDIPREQGNTILASQTQACSIEKTQEASQDRADIEVHQGYKENAHVWKFSGTISSSVPDNFSSGLRPSSSKESLLWLSITACSVYGQSTADITPSHLHLLCSRRFLAA